MALRLSDDAFAALAQEELGVWLAQPGFADRVLTTVAVSDEPDPFPLAFVMPEAHGIVLRKKAILALVDTAAGAREIVRNLIRWGLEQR